MKLVDRQTWPNRDACDRVRLSLVVVVVVGPSFFPSFANGCLVDCRSASYCRIWWLSHTVTVSSNSDQRNWLTVSCPKHSIITKRRMWCWPHVVFGCVCVCFRSACKEIYRHRAKLNTFTNNYYCYTEINACKKWKMVRSLPTQAHLRIHIST